MISWSSAPRSTSSRRSAGIGAASGFHVLDQPVEVDLGDVLAVDAREHVGQLGRHRLGRRRRLGRLGAGRLRGRGLFGGVLPAGGGAAERRAQALIHDGFEFRASGRSYRKDARELPTSQLQRPRRTFDMSRRRSSWQFGSLGVESSRRQKHVQLADFGRLGARQERFLEDARDSPGRRSCRYRGRCRRSVMPSGALNVTLARPASARVMNAVQIGSAACVPLRPTRLVVVQADPDHRQQLGREADEPGIAEIVGRARSCRRRRARSRPHARRRRCPR